MFQAIYRDLKDRFGVASYRDIKRKDLRNCLEYVSAWIEPADLRSKQEYAKGGRGAWKKKNLISKFLKAFLGAGEQEK